MYAIWHTIYQEWYIEEDHIPVFNIRAVAEEWLDCFDESVKERYEIRPVEIVPDEEV